MGTKLKSSCRSIPGATDQGHPSFWDTFILLGHQVSEWLPPSLFHLQKSPPSLTSPRSCHHHIIPHHTNHVPNFSYFLQCPLIYPEWFREKWNKPLGLERRADGTGCSQLLLLEPSSSAWTWTSWGTWQCWKRNCRAEGWRQCHHCAGRPWEQPKCCEVTRTPRLHPGVTLARVPLPCRGRSKPWCFCQTWHLPTQHTLGPCSGGVGWIRITGSEVTPSRNMARSG